MPQKFLTFFLWIGLTFTCYAAPFHQIEQHRIFTKQYTQNGTLFLITRAFIKDRIPFYLITNTQTLKTFIKPEKELTTPLQEVSKALKSTPFGHLLDQATSMVDTGGLQSIPASRALHLTMDMCPSFKEGYEDTVLDQATSLQRPLPIAIAITKKWVDFHEKSFQELLTNSSLAITWVNHSSTHFYDKTLPLHENFLLHVGTDISREILDVESMLLSYGITPSIFFRFPGLIADTKLMKTLRTTYFLVPLGSNAWIAKGEIPQKGSIILIHGNKNEPRGIELFQKQLPSLLKEAHFAPLITHSSHK